MIQIIIADDHPLIRKGIKQLLSETKNIRVIDETDDWRELIRMISHMHYDLVLLDINLPERNGLDILQDIKQLKPEQAVIILSIYEDEEYIVKAIERGADGYLSKTSEPSILISAIEKVVNGDQYISEHLASKLIFHTKKRDDKSLESTLSKRELQILKKICEGKAPKMIAQELFISTKTVNAHREHILQKLNINSTAELIRYAISHNI